MERYESEFYRPILSDWRNFETWYEDGAIDSTVRANGIFKRLLDEYKRPELDPGVVEELDRFVKIAKEQREAATN